jgi:hypothetical protein
LVGMALLLEPPSSASLRRVCPLSGASSPTSRAVNFVDNRRPFGLTRHTATACRKIEDALASLGRRGLEEHARERIGNGAAQIALIDLGRITFDLAHDALL